MKLSYDNDQLCAYYTCLVIFFRNFQVMGMFLGMMNPCLHHKIWNDVSGKQLYCMGRNPNL